MKTVLVCAVQAPFIAGGAEILVSELRANLERRGFRVDVANVPFKWYPVSELVRQALAWRLLDVTESNGTPRRPRDPDQVPELPGAPSAQGGLAVPPAPRGLRPLRHAVLLLHATRPEDQQVREAIQTMDTAALAECRAHLHDLAQRGRAAARATTASPATPLYPPPHHLGRYRTDGYGDYLFYAGRLDRLKRLDLAIDAMQRVRSGARLKIAGTGPLAEELRKQIERPRASRIAWSCSASSPPTSWSTLYAGCRAAYYAPLNEDYGYVTVEAFLSRKPVVTTTDAGGPLEFVTDGETGVVAEPEPGGASPHAIDRLWALPPARLRGDGRRRATRASRTSPGTT